MGPGASKIKKENPKITIIIHEEISSPMKGIAVQSNLEHVKCMGT